jgi:hypothetical protein
MTGGDRWAAGPVEDSYRSAEASEGPAFRSDATNYLEDVLILTERHLGGGPDNDDDRRE